MRADFWFIFTIAAIVVGMSFAYLCGYQHGKQDERWVIGKYYPETLDVYRGGKPTR